MACQIRVDYTNRAAFEATLLTTAPIKIAGVVWQDATLIKLDNHQMTPLPVVDELPDFEAQYHFYDAEWIIGGLPTP
jgi:hypothetical protein